MSTKNQSIKIFFKKPLKNRRPKFNKSPQRRGIVRRVRISTPRKPNSARRPVVKVFLTTKKHALAHIPGQGHNLRKFSKILVSGVGARDLPTVNYTCIRGVLDFAPQYDKVRRRSIYGVKQPNEFKIRIRKGLRHLYTY